MDTFRSSIVSQCHENSLFNLSTTAASIVSWQIYSVTKPFVYDRDRENLETLCGLLGQSAVWTLE